MGDPYSCVALLWDPDNMESKGRLNVEPAAFRLAVAT
jgi:hypothetical protein